MTWFIGLLVIGLGMMMVIKTEWIHDFTGPIDFAERFLGTEGGTRLFIKILGVLLILGAFLGVTGLLGSMVNGIFGPLLGKANI